MRLIHDHQAIVGRDGGPDTAGRIKAQSAGGAFMCFRDYQRQLVAQGAHCGRSHPSGRSLVVGRKPHAAFNLAYMFTVENHMIESKITADWRRPEILYPCLRQEADDVSS
jgi:hypothetical protein